MVTTSPNPKGIMDEGSLKVILSEIDENLNIIYSEASAIHDFLTGTIPPAENINTADCLMNEVKKLKTKSSNIKELAINISNCLGVKSLTDL